MALHLTRVVICLLELIAPHLERGRAVAVMMVMMIALALYTWDQREGLAQGGWRGPAQGVWRGPAHGGSKGDGPGGDSGRRGWHSDIQITHRKRGESEMLRRRPPYSSASRPSGIPPKLTITARRRSALEVYFMIFFPSTLLFFSPSCVIS